MYVEFCFVIIDKSKFKSLVLNHTKDNLIEIIKWNWNGTQLANMKINISGLCYLQNWNKHT